MADTPNPALGEEGRLVIAGSILCILRATANEDPGEIRTTCTETGGFNTRTREARDLVIDFEAQYDPATDPFDGPPKMEAGTNTPGTVIFYPAKDRAAGAFWKMTVGYYAACTCVIDAQGVQTYTGQIKNQGIFYTPNRPG